MLDASLVANTSHDEQQQVVAGVVVYVYTYVYVYTWLPLFAVRFPGTSRLSAIWWCDQSVTSFDFHK